MESLNWSLGPNILTTKFYKIKCMIIRSPANEYLTVIVLTTKKLIDMQFNESQHRQQAHIIVPIINTTAAGK